MDDIFLVAIMVFAVVLVLPILLWIAGVLGVALSGYIFLSWLRGFLLGA